MPANKSRLYLGYWVREDSAKLTEPYHAGILLTSKEPDEDAPSKVFHVTNKNRSTKLTDPLHWKFEAREAKARTARLTGVVFLGKVSPKTGEKDIEDILKHVHVPSPDQEEKDWSCTTWASDALELLADSRILTGLPSSGRDIWLSGLAFIREMTLDTNGQPAINKPVFTCNMSGQEILGEIGR